MPASDGAEPSGADPSPRDRSSSRPWWGRFVAVAGAVLVADQITKIWAVEALADRDIDLFWTLRFHLIRNTGFSFGLGSGLGRWLSIVIIGVVVVLVRFAKRSGDRVSVTILGAIVGGAVGNLIDRIARADDGLLSGGVIDFIDFQWWPIFNIADMAVVLGALALIWRSMSEDVAAAHAS